VKPVSTEVDQVCHRAEEDEKNDKKRQADGGKGTGVVEEYREENRAEAKLMGEGVDRMRASGGWKGIVPTWRNGARGRSSEKGSERGAGRMQREVKGGSEQYEEGTAANGTEIRRI
jgi:hypothetical protein